MFIANAGDNFWYNGLYVCPDVDILLYSLSGSLDVSKGWGVDSDTFNVRGTTSQFQGFPSWFSLGDRDLALSLRRTELIQGGWRLSSITSAFSSIFGIRDVVIPSTDDRLETFLQTNLGQLHLQEFWVKNKGSLKVQNVHYSGLNEASPNPRFAENVESKVILCPANPITSILPIISLKGINEKLKRARVAAVSPFIGTSPISGPAGRIMEALKLETSSAGVASLYSNFLDILVVDSSDDREIIRRIMDEGMECLVTKTIVKSSEDEISLAREIVGIL